MKETRERVSKKSQEVQDHIKKVFDKKTKDDDFKCQGLVLKWDSHIEGKGKHGNFENIWKGSYRITAFSGKKSFILEGPQGEFLRGGPVNGRFLKNYIS